VGRSRHHRHLRALSFAELGALFAGSGEYVYLRAAYGDVSRLPVCVQQFPGRRRRAISAYGAAVAIFLADIYRFDSVWFERTLHIFGSVYTFQLGVGR